MVTFQQKGNYLMLIESQKIATVRPQRGSQLFSSISIPFPCGILSLMCEGWRKAIRDHKEEAAHCSIGILFKVILKVILLCDYT